MNGPDPDDTRPPYQQVAAAIRELISSGQLAPGAKLPKHDDLTETYGVSLGTVKRALGTLQEEGLIVSRRGEGAFVRTGSPPTDPTADGEDTTDLRQVVEDLARRLAVVESRLEDMG